MNDTDIHNAYLQAPSSETYYTIGGPEFGLENVGKRALIRRALYNRESVGRYFRNHVRECMDMLHLMSCPTDHDVWMRRYNKSGGFKYYTHVLLYVDDILIVSEHGDKVLREDLGKYFELKKKPIAFPSFYLGGKLHQVTLVNEENARAFGSSKYIQASVSNIEKYREKNNSKLLTRCNALTSDAYRTARCKHC